MSSVLVTNTIHISITNPIINANAYTTSTGNQSYRIRNPPVPQMPSIRLTQASLAAAAVGLLGFGKSFASTIQRR
jgi:hypothetical protein